MHVERLRLQRFMGHDDTEMHLPRTGLVIVVGRNGSGKSSLLEAVPYAAFGRTLRKTNPWHRGSSGALEMDADGRRVIRERSERGATTVRVRDDYAHDTPTKALAEVKSWAGTFDVWSTTHVFSDELAVKFSTAGDKERKLQIEAFLGLEGFDGALELCRDDLKKSQKQLSSLQSIVAAAEAELKAAREELGRLVEDEPEAPDEPEPDADALTALEQARAATRLEKRGLRSRLSGASERQIAAQAAERSARTELSRAQRDACPACGAPIPQSERVEAQEKMDRAVKVRQAADRDMDTEAARVQAEEDELAEEEAGLTEQIGVLRRVQTLWDAYRKQAGRVERQQSDAEQRVYDLMARVETQQAKLAEQEEQHEILKLSEGVLGTRGVRAQMLSGSLSAVEDLANAWMTTMFPGVTIGLASDTKLKRGGYSDRISLTLDGLDHDEGYRGCSRGEKRRVDIALLLGLAEVASVTRDGAPGTLWFDEILDTLDDDGIESVANVLGRLSETRAVVVITHSQSLAVRLGEHAAHFYTVDGGQLIEAVRPVPVH